MFALVKLVERRPTTSAKTPVPASQPARLPRWLRSASAAGDESRRRRGSELSRPWISPVPTSRPRAIASPATKSSAAVTAGRTRTAGRGSANGRSSSLHPSEDEHGGGELDRHATGRGELARDRADPREHRPGRDRRQRQVRRSADRQAARGQAERQGEPEQCAARTDRRDRGEICGSALEHTGEDELLASRLLLGAKRPDGGQQAPDGGDDRADPPDPPGGVAADRQQVVRVAVEELDRLVRPEARGEREPLLQRRIGVPVADDVGEGDQAEEPGEGDVADARVRDRPPGDRPSRRHACPTRRSGAGRSPRATARGSSGRPPGGRRARRAAAAGSPSPRSAARSRRPAQP